MRVKKSGVLALLTLVAMGAGPWVTQAAADNEPAQTSAALPPGYELVRLLNANVGNFQRRTLYCPGAKMVLGGGAEARGDRAILVGSFPTDDGRGWIGIGRQDGGTSVGISVFAICAT